MANSRFRFVFVARFKKKTYQRYDFKSTLWPKEEFIPLKPKHKSSQVIALLSVQLLNPNISITHR